MVRRRWRIAFFLALGLLLAGGAGFARAAVGTFDALIDPSSPASLAAQLLGPIDEVGRNGWDCRPERAAKARLPRDAELPRPTDP